MSTGQPTARRTPPRRPFAAPHVYVLAVVEGSTPHGVHRVTAAETVIGRGEDADFTLDDTEVSKRHCQVRVDGPTCHLLDLGSLNGTRLNGRETRPGVAQRLRHLDEIQIGGTRLLFLGGRFSEPKRAG